LWIRETRESEEEKEFEAKTPIAMQKVESGVARRPSLIILIREEEEKEGGRREEKGTVEKFPFAKYFLPFLRFVREEREEETKHAVR